MPTRDQLFQTYALFARAVQRHWRKGAVAFGLTTVLALVGALVMPRSYYSEARLFVRFGRENQVDPTASGGQMVALYESRESEINSLIEILKSRAILDRVVNELGPGLVLYGRAAKPEASTDKRQATASSTQSVPTTRKHQLAVTRLTKDVSISAPRKSNIITVACKARSPAVAQQIVAKLVEVYQEEHVRVHRSPGSYEFFEQQAQQSMAAWQTAADALRATKDRLGIVTIEGRRKHLDDTIADVHFKRLASQAELKATQAKIASLEAQIESLPKTLITQETTAASAAADGMRQTLYTLEAQEHELAAKMQDTHPRLAAVRQQVVELREILDDQPADRVQATEALNPARQTLETSLLTEKTHAEALAAADRALAAQQQQLHGELTGLNAQAITIDELTQRVALAESNHKEYSQRLEQARITRTLDDERISSLSLVQPASYVATPAGPRRSLVFALGLVVAGLSGLAAVAIAACLNPVLTTVEQLAAALDVPLAGFFPRSPLSAAA
jgi:uncharacterized protein involved in exopolysaccharide biosynthesis